MKHLLIYTLCFVLFTTCKKYPEGGFLKQGPKTLITDKNGYWQLNLYEVNGIDSTNLISSVKDLFSFSTYKDAGERRYHSSILLFFYENVFSESNKNMGFYTSGGYNANRSDSINGVFFFSRNIFCPEANGTVWNIIKLRDKECILTYSNKNNYKIILKR